MGSGLQALQDALDAEQLPEGWPDDVCRDAFCGYWERNNGAYYWHRKKDHPKPRGTCTVCGRDYALTVHDKVRAHPRYLKGVGSGVCKGSSKPPVEDVV